MRMIEQEIITALQKGKDFCTPKVQDMYRKKEGHRDVITWSKEYGGLFSYKLWGHTIAAGDTFYNNLTIADCGYPTATTKSRINAVFAAFDIPMSCSVKNKKMVFYLNGKEVSGPDIKADDWTVNV
jgi:hypothetical protein